MLGLVALKYVDVVNPIWLSLIVLDMLGASCFCYV